MSKSLKNFITIKVHFPVQFFSLSVVKFNTLSGGCIVNRVRVGHGNLKSHEFLWYVPGLESHEVHVFVMESQE